MVARLSFHLRRSEQFLFHILARWIIGFCCEKTHHNFFDGVSVIQLTNLELCERVGPCQVPVQHKADSVDKAGFELVPELSVVGVDQGFKRGLDTSLSGGWNARLILRRAILANSVKQRAVADVWLELLRQISGHSNFPLLEQVFDIGVGVFVVVWFVFGVVIVHRLR